MTELFGLEHAHSQESEALRKEVSTLEAKVLHESATQQELARYEKLRNELTNDLGELADRRLRAVLGKPSNETH